MPVDITYWSDLGDINFQLLKCPEQELDSQISRKTERLQRTQSIHQSWTIERRSWKSKQLLKERRNLINQRFDASAIRVSNLILEVLQGKQWISLR